MGRNQEIEEGFVQTFVTKQYRERALFELGSKKKRINFFSKLCHKFDQFLDDRFMVVAQTSFDTDTHSLLKSHGAPANCYTMSYISELDTQTLSLKDALHEVVGLGMPSIIICVPEKLAYFESETCNGAPPRFMLKKDGKIAK